MPKSFSAFMRMLPSEKCSERGKGTVTVVRVKDPQTKNPNSKAPKEVWLCDDHNVVHQVYLWHRVMRADGLWEATAKWGVEEEALIEVGVTFDSTSTSTFIQRVWKTGNTDENVDLQHVVPGYFNVLKPSFFSSGDYLCKHYTKNACAASESPCTGMVSLLPPLPSNQNETDAMKEGRDFEAAVLSVLEGMPGFINAAIEETLCRTEAEGRVKKLLAETIAACQSGTQPKTYVANLGLPCDLATWMKNNEDVSWFATGDKTVQQEVGTGATCLPSVIFPDLIRIELKRNVATVTVIDIKRAETVSPGHKMQVAMYARVLQRFLPTGPSAGSVAVGGEVWTFDGPGLEWTSDDDVDVCTTTWKENAFDVNAAFNEVDTWLKKTFWPTVVKRTPQAIAEILACASECDVCKPSAND